MKFSSRQIELAIQFKESGLSWEPSVENYVYDSTNAVKPTSPFQEGVYFLLNYDCFMERVGGIERFKQIMTWLPTWGDAREILRSLGVLDDEVQEALIQSDALRNASELTLLYELIAQRLRVRVDSVNPQNTAT